jgi:exopolyphosphatase/guanosine-5'-triphosphate,3'-diphosphate pyrophosphatase
VLDRPLRDRITRLAAILRIADGLDRGHAGAVDRVRVRYGPRALRISAIAKRGAGALRLELWGATRKAELLGKVAGMPVEITKGANGR